MFIKILLLSAIFLHFSQASKLYPRDTFKIVLDNKNEVYAPGDDVKGNLVLKTPKDSAINNVVLRFVGQAYGFADYGEKFGVYQSNIAPFINESKVLVKKEVLAKSKEFKYPFSFKIPANSLTSVEAFPAKIRYGFEVEISETDGSTGIPARYLITVVNGIDLSKSDEYSKPASCEGSKFGVNIKATVIKRGFVDGENITLTVEIDNKSNEKTDSIHAELIVNKTSILKKGGKTYKIGDAVAVAGDSREIRTREYETYFVTEKVSVNAKSKEKFTVIALSYETTIPSFAPKTLPPFLSIRHRLDVEVKHANGKNTISCSIPLTIGTVPTKDVKKRKPAAYVADKTDVLINDSENVLGNYAPKYPLYDFTA
ncbi:unnamed protein product [Caenorhabditis angaria]|uniref:Arrestin C-terminal-like domain-containing protein n=1 Tax=Caenorhabditis angaria TaxID=860376 RepID=A0A9P1IDP9_9PELO|nr:unnamed protein product [Caenorhabditis angaria]